jgi:hypothetical protein
MARWRRATTAIVVVFESAEVVVEWEHHLVSAWASKRYPTAPARLDRAVLAAHWYGELLDRRYDAEKAWFSRPQSVDRLLEEVDQAARQLLDSDGRSALPFPLRLSRASAAKKIERYRGVMDVLDDEQQLSVSFDGPNFPATKTRWLGVSLLALLESARSDDPALARFLAAWLLRMGEQLHARRGLLRGFSPGVSGWRDLVAESLPVRMLHDLGGD